MTSAPFTRHLRLCVIWLCELEITRRRTPERSHLRSSMGQTPHLNLKLAIKPPVWLPHAHLNEWTSNLKRLSGLLRLFMSLCAEMLSLAGLFLSSFLFFSSPPSCESWEGVLCHHSENHFLWPERKHWQDFLLQSCVYAICTRCCTSVAQNFEFTHWWYTAAPTHCSHPCFMFVCPYSILAQKEKHFVHSL